MSAKKVGQYQKNIRRIIKCSANDAVKIENIMRDDVLHTVALDWLSLDEFDTAARKAANLLDANRADYEEFFAAARAVFDQMNAAKTVSS
jgi:hypothetical protein